MNSLLQLTTREQEVAELLAWGAAKKEIPDKLGVSYKMVDKATQNIYKKLGIQKVSELCVTYFTQKFNISMDFSPLKRSLLSGLLIFLLLGMEMVQTEYTKKEERARRARTEERAPRFRKNENQNYYYE